MQVLNICGRNVHMGIVAASFPREEYRSESSGLAMSGRGKRVRGTAKAIIFNVYKYFERQASKVKYRGPS